MGSHMSQHGQQASMQQQPNMAGTPWQMPQAPSPALAPGGGSGAMKAPLGTQGYGGGGAAAAPSPMAHGMGDVSMQQHGAAAGMAGMAGGYGAAGYGGAGGAGTPAYASSPYPMQTQYQQQQQQQQRGMGGMQQVRFSSVQYRADTCLAVPPL